MTFEERFWSMVSKDCWIWKGALQRDGYAHFGRNGKTISAHRYVYETLVGPIPEGMDVLHRCDVRSCVNPAHLFLGSHAENMADMKRKRRTTYGERNSHATLTDDMVREIRPLFGKVTQREIAKRFGVGLGAIAMLSSGKTWRHVK
jgi:hypothetical protein